QAQGTLQGTLALGEAVLEIGAPAFEQPQADLGLEIAEEGEPQRELLLVERRGVRLAQQRQEVVLAGRGDAVLLLATWPVFTLGCDLLDHATALELLQRR